jgi:hypothetical protein
MSHQHARQQTAGSLTHVARHMLRSSHPQCTRCCGCSSPDGPLPGCLLQVDPHLTKFIEELKLTLKAPRQAHQQAASSCSCGQCHSNQQPGCVAVAAALPATEPVTPPTPEHSAGSSSLLSNTLLPRQLPQHQGKMTILLDLDGTLVSSFTPRRAPKLPASMRTHIVGRGSQLNPGGVFVVERPGLQEFLVELTSFAEVVIFTAGEQPAACLVHGTGCNSRVVCCLSVRLLNRAVRQADVDVLLTGGAKGTGMMTGVCHCVHMWYSVAWLLMLSCVPPPAGLEDYARPIVEAIDPQGSVFSACIFREGTVRTEHYQCVKDMQDLGRCAAGAAQGWAGALG